MHAMHLRSIDLNLLVVLDALLATRSTTLAARQLALSQPATSHALARLRELLSDPLLVREGRGLVPTAYADAIAPRVRSALASLESAIRGPDAFVPEESKRLFTIGSGDYTTSVLGPALVALLAAKAPGVDLFLKGNTDLDADSMLREELDLVLAPPTERRSMTNLVSAPLFDDRFVCLVREGHPLGRRRLTLDRYCELGHVLVTPRGATREGIVDAMLRAQGRHRRVAVALPHFLVAPQVIAETDYVLTLASRVASRVAPALGLRVVEPPLEIPGFTIAMHWHVRSETDAGHRFLREQMRIAARRPARAATRAKQDGASRTG